MTIKELIENKSSLDYQQICASLIQTFRVDEKVNWDSVLPAQQQQEYFGGETLRLIAEHPILSKQKDIRPIALKKGSISQMLFFYVCLNDSTLPKKQIQDVTKKFISGGDANRYIIWFFGNKENTQLKVVLSAKEGKKVVLKTLPFGVEQPYYKTYNFILNEVNQKVSGLFVEPTDLWKALWSAFDISIINRKFYDEINEAFTDLLKQLNKKGTPFTNEEDKVQFAIRLIGRIIFCWFLKRKGVLHDAAISSEAVKAHSQKNYYLDLLEPLFFDVLNTPEKERKGGLPKIIAHYPFLNGGLFEAQETDYKHHHLLNIDNDWFYNLFSKTLERYNFTVDENSSSNAEIAIDPEMLGRIFENLLAEQNPETGDSARKATGSFYTPREIVDYMVEQSIAEFLKTALATDEKNNLLIEDFVHTQILPDALAKHEERISEELGKIKVLDPACGSGAFPIGILQKIVALKQQLHPKAKNYKLKLDTIQNSIYGLDIQPMAVELSRLRCWLSLVVDEDPKDIKALPNLDFKFVCADSLVDVPLIEGYTTDALEKSLTTLEENVEQYFSPDYKNKKKIRENIEKSLKGISKFYHNLIASLITKLRQEEKTASTTRLKQLRENLVKYSLMDAQWNSYENIFKNKKVEFFNPTFFFPSAKKGFDIVIGNPPYISHDKIRKELKAYFKTNYKSFEPFADMYCFFIEKSLSLVDENGLVCLITSNSYLKSEYGKPLRDLIVQDNTVLQILSIEDAQVFESAIVNVAVLISKRGKFDQRALVVKSVYDFHERFNEFVEKSYFLYDQEDFISKSWPLLTPGDLKLLKAIRGNHPSLEKLETKIRLGLATGDNNAFIINSKQKSDFIKLDSKNASLIKPILRGRDINRYNYDESDQYILLTKNGIDVEQEFPTIFKYFDSLGARFKSRGAKGQHWTNLRACSFFDDFKKEKIVWIELTDIGRFALCDEEVYLLNSAYFLLPPHGHSSRYLLAILNSKTIRFFLEKTAETSGMGTSRWINNYVKEFPIPQISEEQQQSFISLVNQILFIIRNRNHNSIHESISNNIITKQLEEVIDGMVLELYFGEEMKSKKVDIIELVEKELEKTKSKNTADSIYNFYKSVSHPDSEIRNRILSFAIVSPDVLKPILQG